jgi:hypothetical protein
MALCQSHNKSIAGYCSVQHQDFGRYGAEITVDQERVWLGTFDMPNLSTRAYDSTAAWKFGWQKRNLNFSKVQSRQEAEFLAPKVRVSLTRA